MTHHEHDELALLLLMVDSVGGGKPIGESPEDAAVQLLYQSDEPGSWYTAPGRSHLPAEIGGRIAEAAPERDTQFMRRSDLLHQFGVGECISDLVPIDFDHKTLSYTGTIFWDTSKINEKGSM